MGLHDGHRQRCKQRFLRAGAEGFDDHQLLELLLFYAIPRCDTNETAHRLLKRFGSLQGRRHKIHNVITGPFLNKRPGKSSQTHSVTGGHGERRGGEM